MIFRFQKDLYSKIALLKAAYHYTDNYYVHLETDADSYIVTISAKNGESNLLTQKGFQNEILAQTVKEIVSAETKNLRTILMARAMSSSMIGEPPQDADASDEIPEEVDDVLKDWFANE